MRSDTPLQERRQDGPTKSDREAIVEYQRFTRQEFEQGAAVGWRFAVGWFARESELPWAWFSREANDG